MNHHRQVNGIEQVCEQLRQHRRKGRRHAAVDQQHAAMNTGGIRLFPDGIDEFAVTGARVAANVQIQTRGRESTGQRSRACSRSSLLRRSQTKRISRPARYSRILFRGTAKRLRSVQYPLAHAASVLGFIAAEIAEIGQTAQRQG